VEAVREVHGGAVTVSAVIASRLLDQMRRLVRVRTAPAHWSPVTALFGDRSQARSLSAGAVAVPELTSREQDVLARVLDGQRVPSIATELYLSQSTVRNHLSAIYKKFDVHSQAELIRRLWST
jgi:DNA-binding NarL/FixJ family response regulator